jgi:DNA-binding response OmpR family regulator
MQVDPPGPSRSVLVAIDDRRKWRPIVPVLQELRLRATWVGLDEIAGALRIQRYDVALVDPAACGCFVMVAAVRALQGDAAATPVVALGAEGLRHVASEAGVDALVPAPVRAEALATVCRLLWRRALVQAAELNEIEEDHRDDEAADQQNARRDHARSFGLRA